MVRGHQMSVMLGRRAGGGRREGFGAGGLTRIGQIRIEPEIVGPGRVTSIVAGVVAELEARMFLAIQPHREACVIHSVLGIGGPEASLSVPIEIFRGLVTRNRGLGWR
jgi:hypothetical protein